MSTVTEGIIVECPHCKGIVVIQELNCHIFRHGVMKDTGNQIDPHASKEVCDLYVYAKMIYGCGKPFKVVKIEDNYVAEICEYI
jgi:hypothetical protein